MLVVVPLAIVKAPVPTKLIPPVPVPAKFPVNDVVAAPEPVRNELAALLLLVMPAPNTVFVAKAFKSKTPPEFTVTAPEKVFVPVALVLATVPLSAVVPEMVIATPPRLVVPPSTDKLGYVSAHPKLAVPWVRKFTVLHVVAASVQVLIAPVRFIVPEPEAVNLALPWLAPEVNVQPALAFIVPVLSFNSATPVALLPPVIVKSPPTVRVQVSISTVAEPVDVELPVMVKVVVTLKVPLPPLAQVILGPPGEAPVGAAILTALAFRFAVPFMVIVWLLAVELALMVRVPVMVVVDPVERERLLAAVGLLMVNALNVTVLVLLTVTCLFVGIERVAP